MSIPKPIAADVCLGYKLGQRFCLLNNAEFISASAPVLHRRRILASNEQQATLLCPHLLLAPLPILTDDCDYDHDNSSSSSSSKNKATEALVCKFCTFQLES